MTADLTPDREAELTAGEWMTLEQVAAYTGQELTSVYTWLRRRGIKRQSMVPTEQVVAAKAAPPRMGRPPRDEGK